MATNFLLIAPNIIVLERLRVDFDGLKIFREDPLIPVNGFEGRDWEEDIDDLERLSRNTTIPQNWVVNLYTDSRELGEIWSKATLKSEMSVEMILWAADQKVFEFSKGKPNWRMPEIRSHSCKDETE